MDGGNFPWILDGKLECSLDLDEGWGCSLKPGRGVGYSEEHWMEEQAFLGTQGGVGVSHERGIAERGIH